MFSKSATPVVVPAKNLAGSELRTVVNDVMLDWHPDSQAAVSAVATAEEFPAEIKDHAAQTGQPLNTIRGVIHKGKVHVVAGNIASAKDAKDAKESLLQEPFGNGGLRATLGTTNNAAFLEVFHRAGGVAGLRALARAFNAEVDFEGHIPKVDRPLTEIEQIGLADEMLAFAAGTSTGTVKMAVLKWVGRIKAVLHTYLERKNMRLLAELLDGVTRADVA
ncbi:MAG: hypothetical protein V4508_15875 [Pseudomonadota bacterium]